MTNSAKALALVAGCLFIKHEYNDICRGADKLAMDKAELLSKESVDTAKLEAATERVVFCEDAEKTANELIDEDFAERINMTEINHLRDIADEAYHDGIVQFKKSIDYDGQLAKFGAEKVKAINDGLNDLDYTVELRDIEDNIGELKDQLDNFDDVLENMDDILDSSDTSMIQRTYERTIKEKMKKLEREKADLVKQKDDIVKAAGKEYDAKVKALNDQINDQKKALQETLKDTRSDLDKKVSDARKAAHDHVYNDILTEEHKEALKNKEKYKNELAELKKANKAKAKDIYDQMSKSEKLAEYAKSKGKTKTDVVMIAAVPAIPVGYVGYKYVQFIKDILGKM